MTPCPEETQLIFVDDFGLFMDLLTELDCVNQISIDLEVCITSLCLDISIHSLNVFFLSDFHVCSLN